MKESQKLDAIETRQGLFESVEYICQSCGKNINTYGTAQIAHCIAKTKANIKKFGTDIINHPMNLKPVCGLYCNSKMNIGFNTEKTKKLVIEIMRNIEERGKQ